MPNCFQLTRKGETEPTPLDEIDEELCTYFGVPVDPDHYMCHWVDTIGLNIALGKPLGSEELRDVIQDHYIEAVYNILKYLETHYTSDAYYVSSSQVV